MINLHERMLPTLAGVEPATSWSSVGRASNWATKGWHEMSRLVFSKKKKQKKTLNICCIVFLKNRHFIIQETFSKLIYGINTIIKCGIWQPGKIQFISHSWNEMIFYCISELMLPTLIQRYNKKIILFLIQFQNQRLKFYRLSDATFYDHTNTIYQFMKPFLDKKCLFFWGIWSF